MAGPEKTLLIRELLKLLPRSFQLLDRTPRDPHLSYVHKIEPVRGSKLNFHGTLYGGTLMRWIETCAHLSARSYGLSARRNATRGGEHARCTDH